MLQEAIDNIKSAIESGRTDVMRSLIVAAEQYSKEDDADKFSVNSVLNSTVASEGTFLHLATMFNQCDIVRLLLAAGADPGIQNESGRTSLDLVSNNAMHAVYVEELLKSAAVGNVGRVCQLLAAGLDINAVDNPESGNTALHWACTFGSSDMVHCLLDRKANVNALNANGCTPLHDAILHDHVEIVEELIKHGADPHTKAITGKFANVSAMDLAADKSKIASVLQQHVPVIENHLAHQLDGCSGSQDSAVDLIQEANLELELKSSFLNKLEDNSSSNSLHNSSDTLPVDQLHLLWPQPQQLTRLDGRAFEIPAQINIYIDIKNDQYKLLQVMKVVNQHVDQLKKLELEHIIDALHPNGCIPSGSVRCCINENVFACQQSYKLKVTSDMISIIASDLTGLHYALCTYSQLLPLCMDKKVIPPVQITDWPNVKCRGVTIDASKEAQRIYTVDYLVEVIKVLSQAKVGQLFVSSRLSLNLDWPCAYSKQELMKLSYHCHKLHVSLNPALESESVVDVSLCAFLQEYVECFPDSRFLLLGPNLSRVLIHDGKIRKITEKCKNHTLLVTCTSPVDSDVSCVLHDHIMLWDHHISKLKESGDTVPQSMNKLGISCGITSEINFDKSLCSCLDLSLQRTLQQAQSVQHGLVLAMVISSWTGNNCWFNMDLLPNFFLSAALGWNCNFSWECLSAKLPQLLNTHVYNDRLQFSGSLVWKLNRMESTLLKAMSGSSVHDMPSCFSPMDPTPLYQLLTEPDDLSLEHLNMDIFQRLIREIKKCQTELTLFRQTGLAFHFVVDEVQFILDLILFACRLGKALVTVGQNPSDCMGFTVVNMGVANLHATTQTDFANKLLSLIEAYEQISTVHRQQQSKSVVQNLNCLVERLIPRNDCKNI